MLVSSIGVMDFAIVATVLLTVASPSLGAVFIPHPIDCRLVLCALPPCTNPLPPPQGQCCPRCPVPSPLVCPPLPPGSVGICVELCSGDDSCPRGQKCCSNGCGHVCKVGVSPTVPPVCRRGGKVYKVGQRFPAGDGCNTCTCVRPGVIVCTKRACVCRRGGKVYKVGQSFPAGDGCNTCTCVRPGIIICTKRACVCRRGGKVYKVGQRFPAGDGCNTCTCIRPRVIVCTEIACPPLPTCPPDKPRVYCFVDPCQVTTCPAHPEARCVSDYCGGCNARFFDDEGNEVTKSCKCPIKGQQFTRCGSACPPTCTNPNPICTLQCVPRCQCPRGKVIDERKNECVLFSQCFP